MSSFQKLLFSRYSFFRRLILPALIVAAINGQVWLVRLLVLLILAMGKRHQFLLNPVSPTLVSSASTTNNLKIMTFNINHYNRNVLAIANLIRAEGPDIIAFQEIHEGIIPSLEAALAADYPYCLIGRGEGSLQGIISHYPIIEQLASPALDTWRTLRVTIKTSGGAVTIWNVHPLVPLKQSLWQAQRNALMTVSEEIKAAVGPLIVLGDFNTTDQTENYQLVADRLTDAHQAIGQGFGFTFPNGLKRIAGMFIFGSLVRIDLALVSEHFLPQEIHVIPNSCGSDHRPVVTTLQWVSSGRN